MDDSYFSSHLSKLRSALNKHLRPDGDLLEAAWSVQARCAFSWWDAMIVAAALQAGCDTLLSEDLQHGQVIDGGLTLVNPFAAHAPQPIPQQ